MVKETFFDRGALQEWQHVLVFAARLSRMVHTLIEPVGFYLDGQL